ncbi:extradiol dioxygenase [Bdellovibrio bacteriovorus]|uniref:Extradiol dioxygenase n=1 Tax=Bdellovibrio bacteriovorus TaxID=959 RepID=A0A161PKL9_BDEBC|nr:VOC family protein [Bdellovibrio bacteriovorus]KYG69700.1 extradiol dioxygenase [Bdellovibrio bacteriovorus]
MARQIYVNLPVKDLKKSMNFFSQLGFEFNMEFTNDQGACLIIGENIYAMLLAEDFFKTFTNKPLVDAKKSTEVLVCFSTDTRKQVDEFVAKAKQAGGTAPRASQDHGFMYQHGFEDLDGHIWEVVSYEQAK